MSIPTQDKLSLRRRLHSLHLRDGDPVQDHIKQMTELFNELAVVGDAITDDDKVVQEIKKISKGCSDEEIYHWFTM